MKFIVFLQYILICCRHFVTWLNETSVSIKWLEEDDEEIEKWEVTDHPPSSDSAWARLWEAVTGNFSRMTIASCLEHPRLSLS